MKKLLSSLLALTMALSLAVLPSSALELEDAKKLLAIHYVDGVAPEVLELDSLDAILEALGDPYTFYMTPEQYQSFNQSVNGRTVVGIGATVETAYDGGYRVMSVLPDSPALEVGIQPGDIITAVDGVPMSPDVDPRVPVTGEEGTVVTLTVNRNGQSLEFTLTRRAVNIPIVTYELRLHHRPFHPGGHPGDGRRHRRVDYGPAGQPRRRQRSHCHLRQPVYRRRHHALLPGRLRPV